ncbi:MAG: Gfo/Idh/MocA family oxidoreductase [Planctomycetota bacterium]|nr:Gfo/Idh/MocA family oxidoreductase [Planctomycetota bacterium]
MTRNTQRPATQRPATQRLLTERTPCPQSQSRREHCKQLIAATTSLSIVPRHVLGGHQQTPPSDQLTVAVIGTGCQGIRHLQALLSHHRDVRVIAVCDVNESGNDYFDLSGNIAGRSVARQLVTEHGSQQNRSGLFQSCTAWRDFRELLAEQQDLDAVLVATPDHTHAAIAMRAIQAGKHVYCEKPLTHTIAEARQLAEASRAAGVQTQMGNQLHALETVRRQVELIQSGVIGAVHEVHAWCVDTGWQGPWGHVRQRRWSALGKDWSALGTRPTETPPVPPGLDWDLWLGPAPYRPYHPAYLPFKWRGWWDFGSGTLGDMGCHILDPAFWALDLRAPRTVEANAVRLNDETSPVAATAHYLFPARAQQPAVSLTWYEGGLKPPRVQSGALPASGLLYVGDGGKLLVPYFGQPILLDGIATRPLPELAPTLPRIPLTTKGPNPLAVAQQQREWIEACHGGPPPQSPFSYAGPLTETVLLGTIAMRTGEKLTWDHEQMQVSNVPDANQLVRPARRAGWNL